jgi:hypothetical protein
MKPALDTGDITQPQNHRDRGTERRNFLLSLRLTVSCLYNFVAYLPILTWLEYTRLSSGVTSFADEKRRRGAPAVAIHRGSPPDSSRSG